MPVDLPEKAAKGKPVFQRDLAAGDGRYSFPASLHWPEGRNGRDRAGLRTLYPMENNLRSGWYRKRRLTDFGERLHV